MNRPKELPLSFSPSPPLPSTFSFCTISGTLPGPRRLEQLRAAVGARKQSVAQEFPPDDLHQASAYDPTEPDPIPDDNLDQTQGG
jgi:hypothetical protein